MLVALGFWLTSLRDSDVIFETESEFGRVRVEERSDGLRSLYIGPGRARQSAVIPGQPRHLELAYTRVAAIGLALIPPDGRILFVGLGGGAMPMYAREVVPEAQVDVVEINPVVVQVAERFFGFRPDAQMTVQTADGRAFIEQAPPGSYDLIVLDAFSDDDIPFALTTRQFLQAVRSRLAPGGVVASNLWSSSDQYSAMVATYQEVFDQVRLVQVPRRAQRILIAGSAASDLDRAALVQAASALEQRADIGFDLSQLVQSGYRKPAARGARILDDRQRPGATDRD